MRRHVVRKAMEDTQRSSEMESKLEHYCIKKSNITRRHLIKRDNSISSVSSVKCY